MTLINESFSISFRQSFSHKDARLSIKKENPTAIIRKKNGLKRESQGENARTLSRYSAAAHKITRRISFARIPHRHPAIPSRGIKRRTQIMRSVIPARL